MEGNNQQNHQAHLFTLRLWQEDLDEGESEWRLQLRCVETGGTHYFRDWPSLVGLLLVMLPGGQAVSAKSREPLDSVPQSRGLKTED